MPTKKQDDNKNSSDVTLNGPVMATPLLGAGLRAAPVSVLITDRQLKIVDLSDRLAAEMGLDPNQVIGSGAIELFPVLSDLLPNLAQALVGEAFTVESVEAPGLEAAVKVAAVDVAPWRPEGAAIAGVIVSIRDITPLRAACVALDEANRSTERLTLALELADLHVWELDFQKRELIKIGADDGFFTDAKTYEELTDNIYAMVDPRDRDIVENAWARHLTDGVPHRPVYRVVRSDNQEVWASASARLVNDAMGQPGRLICAMQNITAQKQIEAELVGAKAEAELANSAKSEFLATMSHEIRTPLNGVLGMAQAMAAGELSTEQRSRLDIVRQSGETLLTILNDILDLSKIEAGKFELEEVEFDLTELANSALSCFTAVASSKGLGLRLSISDDAKGVWLGDSTRIRQILHNLISNALKFTHDGHVDVDISRADKNLCLTVSDTGIGIPADRLPKMFQKFEQAHTSTTRQFGGTGLGLSICRHLANLFGGTIVADSTEGRGSRFVVHLPLMRVGEAGAVLHRETIKNVDADCQPIHILAAEDNAINQLVLKTLLAQAGISPHIVGDGDQAVSAWRDREWDLILMDVQMPIMSGIEATRAIRLQELSSGRRRTPIIALTANAMGHQVASYRRAGFDFHIAKPIQVERLLSTIEEALDQTALHQDCAGPQTSSALDRYTARR